MVYNEEATRKREDPELEKNPYKVYVGVFAKFTPEGGMEPFCLEWTDGKRFFIDRILNWIKGLFKKAFRKGKGGDRA